MAVRFFGQYLLENGVIDAKELLDAISFQERTNLKFGDTAIQIGLMTEDQLSRVFALQRKEDLRTGEAAIKLGYVTEAQVDRILRAQQNSHVMIGEALVQTGALDRTEIDRHLAAFKLDQEPYHFSDGVPAGNDPSGLARPAVDLAMKFLLRLAGFQMKVFEVQAGTPGERSFPTYVARVGFGGDVPGELALRASQTICARIASSMTGEPVTPDDSATVLDATCEFLNVVGGNLAAAAAKMGKKLELGAPKAGDLPTPRPGQDLLVARLGAPEGEIDFVVVTTRP